MDIPSEMHGVPEPDTDYALFDAGLAALDLRLNDQQHAQLARFAQLLREWSGRFNLMGPAALRTLWSRHVLDALTVVLALPGGAEAALATPYTVIDVGTGAGLPGVPLQIVFPHWQVSLLESTTKKVRFLQLAAGELGLSNLTVLS